MSAGRIGPPSIPHPNQHPPIPPHWTVINKIGLKKARRKGPEAAFSTTIAAFEKFAAKGYEPKQIELVFKGFDKGRTGFMNALYSQQGEGIREKVVRITDNTPLQIGRITPPNPKRR